jgi:hypothetical protein
MAPAGVLSTCITPTANPRRSDTSPSSHRFAARAGVPIVVSGRGFTAHHVRFELSRYQAQAGGGARGPGVTRRPES